jgi:ATP-dependent Clp protease, protease subunit
MAEPKTIYVNFFDSIDPNKTKHIMSFLSETINKEKPDVFYCLFSSPGGHVDSGITLYNFIRSLPVEFIMHNTGIIDSIANVIFLAANTRFTSIHSSFLFHGIIQPINANSSLTKNNLQEYISSMNVSESKIAGIIAERTKLTADEVKGLFYQGESKDASFALDKGIVNEIRNPGIPKDAIILSFNLQ